MAKAGWYTTQSEFVDAPLIDELPMMMECRLVSYDSEGCRLVGEIVNGAPTSPCWMKSERSTRTSCPHHL